MAQRLSNYFVPTLRETPAEAQIASHRWMLRAGMIVQETSGIYSWLPLGVRVLEKLQKIICEEQDRIGCHRVILPTIQPAELWKKSGRYEDYGKEMLRMKDRHDREMLYGPTHEEVITDVVHQLIKTYRHIPKVFYQIHWKFRDEIRPRFGVMRAREFLMKDGYSFDLTPEGARMTYRRIFESYLKIFQRMGVVAIPVRAPSGAIGGDMSHEFHIVAPTGESAIYYDRKFHTLSSDSLTYESATSLYAAADEQHSPDECPLPEGDLHQSRGIEIGHIFYFGTKYSEALNAKVTGSEGTLIPLEMGSYGIGVSRLVGAIIEAHHDEQGMKWPQSVAPFEVALMDLVPSKTTAVTDSLYERLCAHGMDVLYDDREERAGVKMSDMDLLGIPWQVRVGNRSLAQGTVEVKNRHSGQIEEIPQDQLLDFLMTKGLSFHAHSGGGGHS